MRNSKLKPVLQMIAIISVVASLLLCLNGCKKKKPTEDTTPSTTEDTVSTTADTQPTTKPTTPKPTTPKPTTPAIPSKPEDTTAPKCVHVLGNWKVDPASTCTTEGTRYKECTLCKEKVETEVIPKTAHSPGSWVVDKKATCTAQGKQHQECTQCKEVMVSIVVGMTDHRVITSSGRPATATSAGFTDKRVCKDCEVVVQESFHIPAIGSVAYTYTVNNDGKTCTITGATGFSDKELILPSSLDNYTVTAIGEKAFANKTSITTLYIPKTVTQIDTKAFIGCYSLTNITYQGTTLQWNTLQKGAEWNAGTGHYTIYCTNTSLSK